MTDELSAPLVRRRERVAGRAAALLGGASFPIARVAAAAIVVLLGAAGLRVLLVEDPGGGRPTAEVGINSTRNANAIAEQLSGNAVTPAAPEAGIGTSTPVVGGPSITTLGEDLPGDPPGPASPVTPPDLQAFGTLADLTEVIDEGLLPRVAPDGTTPFAAYSRPVPPAATGRPMVAVVVTGLGLSERGTLDAVATLPPEVSLAFAPYGKTLVETVGAAQAAGHELLLEVPLEPFDYPANDPGPQTLLTGDQPRTNLDKLSWLMTRIGGYVGVVNNMGARFTSSSADLAPVMEELATRGLGYLDDGSSNRSVAGQLASARKVPFSRADLQIDRNPAHGPILAALADLEAKARETGSAVGVASALPVSVQAIAEWAAGLADRGVVLVPVSALMKATAE